MVLGQGLGVHHHGGNVCAVEEPALYQQAFESCMAYTTSYKA
jgi:hypothetical protein